MLLFIDKKKKVVRNYFVILRVLYLVFLSFIQVLHSQSIRETPLEPWIIAEKSGRILGAHCTCMAGLGETCTHVAALLFLIEETVKLRDSKTVTQEKAYWLLPTALSKVEYRECQKIDFTVTKRSQVKELAR